MEILKDLDALLFFPPLPPAVGLLKEVSVTVSVTLMF